ncbi:MAG TPA: LysR substrate-binding domain-containing protein [Burkholderiaceae bacterium]
MLDDIRAFLAVAEAASFSKVAKSLDVAVSSVSRKIEALESSLGTALFYRTSRVVMLTDAGEQFLPRARNMLAELDDARHSISALSDDPHGLLTVTAPSAFGRRHLAPAVISFLKQYPLMEIDLHLSDHIVDLSAQRVDVAIRLGALPDSDLVATRLAPIARLACASPAYLKKFGTPASPSDLLQHNCVTMATSPPPAGWWCFAGVNRDAALAVRGTLRTDDTDAMLQAAVAGIGIVHLASWLVSDIIVAGKLIPLFGAADAALSDKSPFAVHAVRMPGRSHTAKAQLFIGHLKNEFGSPAYWDRALVGADVIKPKKTHIRKFT